MNRQIVLNKTTKIVKRWGYCNFTIDTDTEEKIENNNFDFQNTIPDHKLWKYVGGEEVFIIEGYITPEEPTEASEEQDSGITSTEWQTKLTLNIPFTCNGKYRIGWGATCYNDGIEGEIRLRNITTGEDLGSIKRFTSKSFGEELYIYDFVVIEIINISPILEVQWRSTRAGKIQYIKNSKIEFRKVL